MKKTISFSIVVVVILALAVVYTTTTAAKASKITTCALQTNTSEIPGKVWFTEDGAVMHIRGQITYADITPLAGHPECDKTFSDGKMIMVLNLNLNLVTGEGNAFGSHTITVEKLDASGRVHIAEPWKILSTQVKPSHTELESGRVIYRK